MKASAWISLLICLNVILGTGVVLVATDPTPAYAQDAPGATFDTGLAKNYIFITGEIQNKFDALYVLDIKERSLHGFYFDKSTDRIVYSDVRDLEADIRNNR
jgi:hypothetical protein